MLVKHSKAILFDLENAIFVSKGEAHRLDIDKSNLIFIKFISAPKDVLHYYRCCEALDAKYSEIERNMLYINTEMIS